MNITVDETTRWSIVQHDANPTPAKLRQAILRGEGIETDFTVITVPAPPRDQTIFKVSGNDNELLVAIALFDAANRQLPSEETAMNDSAEIYFDLRHDHVGWFRFEFTPDGKAHTSSHLPYPEAHCSGYPLLRLLKHETRMEYFPAMYPGTWRCRWIYAWFDTSQIFRESVVCGFNICRYRPDNSYEFSAWNYLSGNGGPDATAFGHLHRNPPAVVLSEINAKREDNRLLLDGAGSGLEELQWEVITPLGERLRAATESQSEHWQAAVMLGNWESGRYRAVPRAEGKAVEPDAFSFDVESTSDKRDFTVSMTWDWPDNIMAQPYTPEGLSATAKMIADWGIERVHWIDYSDAPSMMAAHYWEETYRETARHCGDVLQCAVEQIHAQSMEIVADFKIFDIGINTFHLDHPCTVLETEGCRSVAIPEIVAHREWTLQANPAWRKEPVFPVSKIRFYSRTPLPQIDASAIRLRVSDDNGSYKPYEGQLQVRQGIIERPHYCWTPAGKVESDGGEQNWYVELSDLEINSLFTALQIEGDDVFSRQQGFMLVEAENSQGEIMPLTTATTGHRDFKEEGYFFSKEWPGWNNYTEPILWEREWRLNDIAFTFQDIPDMPTLLEPTYEGARDIWLRRIQKMLDAGVDGVCIRIQNHHNGVMSWLLYAFAPAVIEAFEQRYGRAPETTPEDYERVRRLRGECITQFLRDAKKLTSAAGKKLMVQLESGLSVPPHLDIRMQLFLDYETWLQENIVDEALMKDWTAQSPWVHEHILPLARRQGVPVHIISRCSSNGLDDGAMATTPQVLTDSYHAGFSGYNFYEVANFLDLNPEGVPMSKGYAAPAITKAYRELRTLL